MTHKRRMKEEALSSILPAQLSIRLHSVHPGKIFSPGIGFWQAIKRKVQQDFWSTYLAELAVWPGFQTLNFWKVPVQHQLLVVNLASLIDSTFLCW